MIVAGWAKVAGRIKIKSYDDKRFIYTIEDLIKDTKDYINKELEKLKKEKAYGA